MPRPLRIEFENAWYHVMNRGLNRQPIFWKKSHKFLFYTLLNEIVDRYKIEIHSFCLMKNHYHLLVKTPYANLGRVMRHLDGLYTQRLNRVELRDGPLFRGRYKAVLIDSDQYLLQVSRYIHLNPVSAKICTSPYYYPWSSYRSFIQRKYYIPWLTTDYILNQTSAFNRAISYAEYVKQGIDDETDKFYLKKNLPSIYGSKVFIETHLNNLDQQYKLSVSTEINYTKLIPRKDIILNSVNAYFGLGKNEICKSFRGKKNIPKLIAIYLLSYLGQLTHVSIAEIFTTLKPNSVTPQIIRLKNLIETDRLVGQQVMDICNMIGDCT